MRIQLSYPQKLTDKSSVLFYPSISAFKNCQIIGCDIESRRTGVGLGRLRVGQYLQGFGHAFISILDTS